MTNYVQPETLPSPLSMSVNLEQLMTYHTSFCDLFDELKDARNDAVHQGAHARILTDHAVELAIILEDALMSKFSRVSQFMVRDVDEANSQSVFHRSGEEYGAIAWFYQENPDDASERVEDRGASNEGVQPL